MDQKKIGKFIAEMGKEQNLTQIQLAEALGISNKTISKWECGNGMPDYAVIEELCRVLHINANELLSGERIPSNDYNRKAEENIMSLMEENSKNRKWDKGIMMVSMALIFLLILFVILQYGGIEAIHNFIDTPTIFYMSLITMVVLGMAGKLKDFLKAFTYVIKPEQEITQTKKSMCAVKVAIIIINIIAILAFVIANVTILQVWSRTQAEFKILATHIAVSLLNIVYALIFTVILLPIYWRLKYISIS